MWSCLTDEGKSVFKLVLRELLNNLRSTGVGEDGLLQAWDATSEGRLDGRKLKPCWRSMAKDGIGCATFVVITNVCIKHHHRMEGSSQNASKKRRRGALPSSELEMHKEFVLGTKLCITIPPSNPGGLGSSQGTNADISGGVCQWRAYDSQPLPTQAKEPSESEEQLEQLRLRHLHRKKHTNLIESLKVPIFENEEIENFNSNAASTVDSDSHNIQPPQHGSGFGDDSNMPDGRLEFKNGERVVVGKLLLEPRHKLESLACSIDDVVHAKWEDYRRGLLTAIREKEQAADSRIREWEQQKGSGFLPWMINHMSSEEEMAPYAMEYIRGENLSSEQTVVDSLNQ